MKLFCVGCSRTPEEIGEYVLAAKNEEQSMTPSEYVMMEEGTLCKSTGRFACTDCYIKMGEPLGVASDAWVRLQHQEDR